MPAASTSSTRVTCAPLAPAPTWTRNLAPAGTVSWPAAWRALACRNASPAPPDNSTNPYPLSALNHLTTASTGGAPKSTGAAPPPMGGPPKPPASGPPPKLRPGRGLELVRHRPVVVEPALARRPKVLTLAHVSPKSSPKSPIHESATRPLAVRRISAKLRRDISVRTIFVGWTRHPHAVDPLNGTIPQSANGSRDVVWRARALRSASSPSPTA